MWCSEYLVMKKRINFLSTHDALVIFRNVVFAPLSEELVFRSILIPSLYTVLACPSSTVSNSGELSTAGISLFVARISPIWFGIAHLHHLAERLREGQALLSTLLTTLLQLTYTSIFGYISALLFMRTGSVFSSVCAVRHTMFLHYHFPISCWIQSIILAAISVWSTIFVLSISFSCSILKLDGDTLTSVVNRYGATWSATWSVCPTCPSAPAPVLYIHTASHSCCFMQWACWRLAGLCSH